MQIGNLPIPWLPQPMRGGKKNVLIFREKPVSALFVSDLKSLEEMLLVLSLRMVG